MCGGRKRAARKARLPNTKPRTSAPRRRSSRCSTSSTRAGSSGMMINGVAHGPLGKTATCQLHMRHFKDGEDVWVEPWRARAFPVVKDLIVDRSSLDKIIQAG